MENQPKIEMEGELSHEQKLHEELDSLQIKHVKALEENNETEAKKIEEEINSIEEQLGLNEEVEAA